MKVTLKPLKGDSFQVEVEDDAKVAEIKKKVSELKAELPVESQKLICAGKILTDDQAVQDLGLKADGFIVVMATKAKAAAPAPAATPAAAPAPAPAATPAGETGAPAPDAQAQAAATVVTGSGSEATLTQLTDMGFPRAEAERALAAAFGNPDRAVEYLMNGIPEGILAPAGGAPPPAAGGAPAPTSGGAPAPAPGGAMPFPAMGGATGGGGGGGGGGGAPLPPALQELRNSPQWAQLSQIVATNPAALQQMLPALSQSHPEILQAIQENPEAFMQMLQEAQAQGGGGGGGGGGPGGLGGGANAAQMAAALAQNPQMVEQLLPEIEQSDPELAAAIRQNPQVLVQILQAQAAQGGLPGMGGGGGGGGGPGPTVIRLTEEENAAVDRLVALGFDRNTAAQAYLACDKQEELAANFLFENGGGD